MDLATELILAALNLVLALAAVVLALLAYDVSRARHPFTMSDAVAGVAVLTYNHIRPIWIDEVWVHHWKGALHNPGCSCGLNPPDSSRDLAM